LLLGVGEVTLSRQQLRVLSAKARYLADKAKPPTRKQAKTWLAPIRDAIAEMRTGEVDAIRGYAVTRLHTGDDYARIDYCINGFLCLIERLMPDVDLAPLKTISSRLANGVPLTLELLDNSAGILNQVEDRLIKIARRELVDAANLEQMICEVERLGLDKVAA
jgi:hypothetical protein